MRRQNVIILILLALCLLVVPASAWQDDFQSGTGYGWTGSGDGSLSIVQSPHPDTYALKISTGPYADMYAQANPEQNFNYAAFAVISNAYVQTVKLYSKEGNSLCELSFTDCPLSSWIEVVRIGTNAYLYVNGNLKSQAACNGQPYNLWIQAYSLSPLRRR
jgi:hypothetical protein